MASYIMLCNWTDAGIKTASEFPRRLDAARAAAKTLGGELKDFWMTMGAYDFIVTVEMPDDDAMAKFTLQTAAGGNVRSTTLKAFPEAQYRMITGGL